MPYRTAAFAACLSLPFSCATAHADSGERTPLNLPSSSPAQHATSSSGNSLIHTFVGLAIVIGVIYGLYWVLKQVKASRQEKASGSGLAPIATLPLGGGRSLQVVRAGSEVMIVGVADHGVTPVKTYSEGQARAIGLLDEDEEFGEPSRPTGALDQLRKLTVRR